MNSYLQIEIQKYADPEFQLLISEICQGVGWSPEDFASHSLSFLLMAIGRENKKLTLQHVAPARILAMKVGKLAHGSVVEGVCSELTRLNGMSNEVFYNKSVLTLIMRCYKVFCPKPRSQKKPSKSHLKYQHTVDLINRGRQSRGIWDSPD
jgi:hypothetical protein